MASLIISSSILAVVLALIYLCAKNDSANEAPVDNTIWIYWLLGFAACVIWLIWQVFYYFLIRFIG